MDATIRVVMLSDSCSRPLIAAGAGAYLPKGDPAHHPPAGTGAAARGDHPMAPQVVALRQSWEAEVEGGGRRALAETLAARESGERRTRVTAHVTGRVAHRVPMALVLPVALVVTLPASARSHSDLVTGTPRAGTRRRPRSPAWCWSSVTTF